MVEQRLKHNPIALKSMVFLLPLVISRNPSTLPPISSGLQHSQANILLLLLCFKTILVTKMLKCLKFGGEGELLGPGNLLPMPFRLRPVGVSTLCYCCGHSPDVSLFYQQTLSHARAHDCSSVQMHTHCSANVILYLW